MSKIIYPNPDTSSRSGVRVAVACSANVINKCYKGIIMMNAVLKIVLIVLFFTQKYRLRDIKKVNYIFAVILKIKKHLYFS